MLSAVADLTAAPRVVSVEIVPGLVHMARWNLQRVRRDANVTIVQGDGSVGYPEFAPYDAASVAAGAPDLPPSLFDQLRDPGRLAIPVGDRLDQELRVYVKRDGRVDYRVATQCRFVLLRGGEGLVSAQRG